jgi:hypothetical protein
MSKLTPMQRVIRAFNRLSADEFHKYIYDHGDALLEEEQDLIKPTDNLREQIIELYADTDDIIFADGLDEAIIGFEPNSWQVVYSRNKCIEIMSRDMSEEDAMEYLEYNTFNTYVGEKTPLWVEDFKW